MAPPPSAVEAVAQMTAVMGVVNATVPGQCEQQENPPAVEPRRVKVGVGLGIHAESVAHLQERGKTRRAVSRRAYRAAKDFSA